MNRNRSDPPLAGAVVVVVAGDGSVEVGALPEPLQPQRARTSPRTIGEEGTTLDMLHLHIADLKRDDFIVVGKRWTFNDLL
jgi:hypothetical protein